MFSSWEEKYFFATAPKQVPFPKCLWFHKYLFIHGEKNNQIDGEISLQGQNPSRNGKKSTMKQIEINHKYQTTLQSQQTTYNMKVSP
jgi:hypothetical protein